MPVLTWESIANTPWWVFVLLVIGFKLSLNARKPTSLPVLALLIAPVYCVAIGLLCAFYLLHPTWLQLSNSVVGFILGFGIGWLQLTIHRPAVTPDNQRITLRGSSLPLILFIAGLVITLCYPTFLTSHFQALLSGNYNAYLLLFYGLGAGAACGRFLYAKRALKNATMH